MTKQMTHTAYKVYSARKDEPVGLIWWDGKTIRSSKEFLTAHLKEASADGLVFRDGKEFFDKIPRIFKSGYMYVKKTTVDKDGKEI